jgi:hypothetical protein
MRSVGAARPAFSERPGRAGPRMIQETIPQKPRTGNWWSAKNQADRDDPVGLGNVYGR